MGKRKKSSETWTEQLEKVRPQVAGTLATVENPSKELPMTQQAQGSAGEPRKTSGKQDAEDLNTNTLELQGDKLIIKSDTTRTEILIDEETKKEAIKNALDQQKASIKATKAGFWAAMGLVTISVVGSIVMTIGCVQAMTGDSNTPPQL